MTEPIIVAKQISKTYRTGEVEVHAVRGVDLTIHPGEMVAIMGPSGCGKTTLLNCLSGLDQIDRGEVLIAGTALHQMKDKVRTTYRAQRMGFVFQTFNLLPVLSAVENVEMPLLVSGVRPQVARQRSLAALDSVGLSHRAQHRPAELSGGERQRVTIARSLINKPAIVWADEPTGNLDSQTADDVLSLMQRLNREQGHTFVIVTHDAKIGDLCDRVVTMRDGEIVDDGNGHKGEIRAEVQARELAVDRANGSEGERVSVVDDSKLSSSRSVPV
ncbi:MAG: ABC transporter ATP-binding protein [Anaerolineae bacterium]|nr:ABC transporter ATP-binding protein [Anaerolineae bacterium]